MCDCVVGGSVYIPHLSLYLSLSLARLLNPITMAAFQCDIWDCTSIATRVT